MALNSTIISQFIKNTKDDNKDTKRETFVYGRLSKENSNCVILDGSNAELPIAHFTTQVDPNERVIVMIKNHSAIVTGNITSQSSTVTYVDKKFQEISVSPIDEDTINNLWSKDNT